MSYVAGGQIVSPPTSLGFFLPGEQIYITPYFDSIWLTFQVNMALFLQP